MPRQRFGLNVAKRHRRNVPKQRGGGDDVPIHSEQDDHDDDKINLTAQLLKEHAKVKILRRDLWTSNQKVKRKNDRIEQLKDELKKKRSSLEEEPARRVTSFNQIGKRAQQKRMSLVRKTIRRVLALVCEDDPALSKMVAKVMGCVKDEVAQLYPDQELEEEEEEDEKEERRKMEIHILEKKAEAKRQLNRKILQVMHMMLKFNISQQTYRALASIAKNQERTSSSMLGGEGAENDRRK
jgi:hypothetical protein